jgi:hypothetical protein
VAKTATDIGRANSAAINEMDAADVSSVDSDAFDNQATNQSREEPISLFSINTEDEYGEIIAALCRGDGVAPWVTGAWDRNRMYRISQGIDYKLLSALNRRAGIYSQQQLAAIRAVRGAENYPLLVDKLCRAAKAEISDAFGSVDRPEKLIIAGLVNLSRTERKELVEKLKNEYLTRAVAKGDRLTPDETIAMAEEIEQQAIAEATRKAQKAAHNMEDLIYDQFEDGGWEDAFDKCMDDALTLKKGFIYGPYPAKMQQLRFERNDKGNFQANSTPKLCMRWDHRSPFDIFPAAGARSFIEGDLIDRVRYTPFDLLCMKGVPGWIDHEIDACVKSYGEGGFAYFTSFDSARAYAEERGNLIQRQYGFIEALRFFGHIKGDRLMQTGVPGDKRKVLLNQYYECQAIVCGQHVLFLAVMDPRIDFRPYVGVSFAPDVGGMWGKGFGELVASEDSKNAAAARAEVENSGFCKSPISVRTAELLPGGTLLGPTYPGQVFISNAKIGDTRKAVDFLDVPCKVKELGQMREDAAKEAYELCGLAYPDMGTDRAAGAGRTASGFGDIVDQMRKPMQDFIYRVERDILRPNVKRLIQLNNAYHEDDSVKTEADIEPQGLFAELSRLSNANRKLELYDHLKGDPLVSNRHRAGLIRSIATDQRLPDSIAPTDREAIEMDQKMKAQEQAMMQAQQAQAGAPGAGAAPAMAQQGAVNAA